MGRFGDLTGVTPDSTQEESVTPTPAPPQPAAEVPNELFGFTSAGAESTGTPKLEEAAGVQHPATGGRFGQLTGVTEASKPQKRKPKRGS